MIDWENFKEKKFAVKCTSEKEKFFSECAEHGIYNFMTERVMLRNYFVVMHPYKTAFSEGRYEVQSFDEWQIKPNGLFGKYGLEIVEYAS